MTENSSPPAGPNDPPESIIPINEHFAAALFHAITDAADRADIGMVVSFSGPQPHELELVYLNSALERLVGASHPQILERGIWAFIAPEAQHHLLSLNQARARGDKITSTFQTTLIHQDGRRIPVEVASGRAEINQRPANVLFVTDIKEREQAQEELRRSQALFREVFTHAPDGILILRWPTIVFSNPAGARLLDVPNTDAAIGINMAARLTEDESAIAAHRIRRVTRGERLSEPRQYKALYPSGREVSAEISSMAIEYDGKPAVLAFVRDVTERNQMLQRLVESDKLAAINALAAGVSHEVNNPLAYVLLNLEFLERELRELRDAFGDPTRIDLMQRRLADTRHGAERVKAIMRDLQALTRKDENIRGPVDLDQVLEGALQMAKHEIRQRARIDKRFEPGVPCVIGNSTRLEQLFFNLLKNAAQAVNDNETADHLIRLTLVNGPEGFVTAEISDNGSGMTDDVLAHAFDPFFTTKALGVGAGLGLAICKRIVDDLGGTISFKSTPGVGTTARVSLRAHVEPGAELPTARRRGRVMVVDDERAVAESLRFALRDDHDIDIAGSGKEARAAFEADPSYDVVLCDLVMPVESGMDLYAYVREHFPRLAERFVFMTGGAFTPHAARFLDEVRSPRIEKPFELEALRALIDGLVAERDV